MLKKLIIIFLVVSTFGYGMAWAVDGHLELQSVQTDTSNDHHADDDSPASGEHANKGCDHCCHASAHLIGIAAVSSNGLQTSRNMACSVYTASMISYLELPTAPPPKH